MSRSEVAISKVILVTIPGHVRETLKEVTPLCYILQFLSKQTSILHF